MSTYVLMKILESAPGRYDRGIRLLTLGKVDKAYDRLAERISERRRVLDIGCGTGALTLRAAAKGASVRGIDINPQMLEIAEKRLKQGEFADFVEFREMGVAELDGEPSEGYDVVMSGLCFSELSADEVEYTLKQAKRVLKPGGMLLLADEIRPGSIIKRVLNGLLRLPLVVITYIITQTTTHAVRDLPEKVREAGFKIESLEIIMLETFVTLVARKPEREAP